MAQVTVDGVLVLQDVDELHDMLCVWNHTQNMNVYVEDEDQPIHSVQMLPTEDMDDETYVIAMKALDLLNAALRLVHIADWMMHSKE